MNQRRMPVTRAGKRQLAGSGGIQPPPVFQTGSTEPGESAATGDTGGASADVVTMIDPVGLKDSQILKLRASVKTSRKLVDDLILEIADHIQNVEKAKVDPEVPKNMVHDYSKQLKDLFDRGDALLIDFETKNSLHV